MSVQEKPSQLDIFTYEDWDKIDISTAKFVLDQGEKFLAETVEAGNVLTNRAGSIMQISIPAVGVLVGVVATNLEIEKLQYQLAIIGVLLSGIVSYLAFKVYHLYKIIPLGMEPNKILTDEKIKHIDQQELVFVYNAIKNCQKSIAKNQSRNEDRAKKIIQIETVVKVGLIASVAWVVLYYVVYHP
jgi:hypothetical protein